MTLIYRQSSMVRSQEQLQKQKVICWLKMETVTSLPNFTMTFLRRIRQSHKWLISSTGGLTAYYQGFKIDWGASAPQHQFLGIPCFCLAV